MVTFGCFISTYARSEPPFGAGCAFQHAKRAEKESVVESTTMLLRTGRAHTKGSPEPTRLSGGGGVISQEVM